MYGLYSMRVVRLEVYLFYFLQVSFPTIVNTHLFMSSSIAQLRFLLCTVNIVQYSAHIDCQVRCILGVLQAVFVVVVCYFICIVLSCNRREPQLIVHICQADSHFYYSKIDPPYMKTTAIFAS